jgi:hypothetical protein
MANSKTTLTINVRISWSTIIRSAFMRIFCRELYDKFAKEYQLKEEMIEVDTGRRK